MVASALASVPGVIIIGVDVACHLVGQRKGGLLLFVEQVEVLSLAGDITSGPEGRKVHAHVVMGKADGTAHGGHLIEARVRPTLEIVLTEAPRHLHRRFDSTSGLALIDPSW